MRSGVIAQKVGMTRVFTDAGLHVPVTVLRLGRVLDLGEAGAELQRCIPVLVVGPMGDDLAIV